MVAALFMHRRPVKHEYPVMAIMKYPKHVEISNISLLNRIAGIETITRD